MANQSGSTVPSTSGPRSDLFTFVVHWAMVGALIVSLLTGLRIAVDYADSITGSISRWMVAILPEGAVITWHLLSSWTLFVLGVAYVVFLWKSRQAARVVADRSVIQSVRTARQRGRLWTDRSAWFAINRLLYQIAFFLLVLMALTGLALYTGQTLGLGVRSVATVHGLAAYGILAYVLFHMLAQFKAGTFWKIFKPRFVHVAVASAAGIVAVIAVGAVYLFDHTQSTDLEIAKVNVTPILDGHPDDAAWQQTAAVTINTARGENLPGGEVPVEVRAVHDGERVYFQFRWPDAQRSYKHLPMIKVQGGWHVMQSKFEVNDEDDYYEDKFSVVLAHVPSLGSGTVHLGQNLISGPHRPTNRGLHYTSDGSYADMWHWKSVRTGLMTPSLVDDNYFGPPAPSTKSGKRYKGGYAADPSDGGGYSLNWTKLQEDKPLSETLVQPKFLPTDPNLLRTMERVSFDPEAGDKGVWFLKASNTQPYRPELDTYPMGTVMPSVVIKGPFQGDRGDLISGSNWRDGYWTLEVARVYDTGSMYDVPIKKDGKDVFLWVAVFNHTQTRHSQQLHPIRLVLGE